MLAHAEPVTFLRAGERTDPYSGEVVADDWSAPVVALEDVAGVEPIASDEPLQDGRQSVITGYRLYLDHEAPVDPSWRVEVRGDVLAVQGRPARWRSPFTGWEAGTVVEARWVDG